MKAKRTLDAEALNWSSMIGDQQEAPEPPEPTTQPQAPAARPLPAQRGKHYAAIDRTPPHDEGAEKSFLGAMLLDSARLLSMTADVPPDFFYVPAHRTLYEAMKQVDAAGQCVDIITLTSRLREDGQLDAIGGDAAVDHLIDSCPTAAHAGFYLEILRENHNRRLMIQAARAAEAAAFEGTKPAEAAVALFEVAGTWADWKAGTAKRRDLPSLRNIAAFQTPAPNEAAEILRNRFLCRGGAVLLVGPTGIGKSSFVLQGAISWALGRPFFDIAPVRPTRILMVQAENDDGDLAEMRNGVYRGLMRTGDLTEDDQAQLAAMIEIAGEDSRTGRDFGHALDGLLAASKPDLCIIDPALAYLGGDALKQADVTLFCRNILNPIIHRHGCGLVLVHHTNKPPKQEENGNGWKAGDLAYLGQGAADWANWARGVIAIRSTGTHDVYDLCLGKRGRRIGWRDSDGNPIFSRRIAHAKDGGIYWRMPSDAEVFDSAKDIDSDGNRGRPKHDWTGAAAKAVALAKEKVRTRAQLKRDIFRMILELEGDERRYGLHIAPAIECAVDDGQLAKAKTHDGTGPVHLIGPPGGAVQKRVDQIQAERAAARQKDMEL